MDRGCQVAQGPNSLCASGWTARSRVVVTEWCCSASRESRWQSLEWNMTERVRPNWNSHMPKGKQERL